MCIYFFGTVFQKNCTAFSQSELKNFSCILLLILGWKNCDLIGKCPTVISSCAHWVKVAQYGF